MIFRKKFKLPCSFIVVTILKIAEISWKLSCGKYVKVQHVVILGRLHTIALIAGQARDYGILYGVGTY